MSDDELDTVPHPGRRDPAEAAAALRDAALALQAGRWAEAEEQFARGISADPADARLHGGLAICAIHQGDWDRAVALGRTAAALPGAVVEVHTNLGWSLEHVGRAEEALTAYQRAFQLDPHRVEPIHHLLRLGSSPADDEGQPSEPCSLETLQRVDLYEAVGNKLRTAPCPHTFAHSAAWALDRQAPWPGVAAWLVQQGVHCDCAVLKVLLERDRALTTAIVSGLLIADPAQVETWMPHLEVFQLLGPGEVPDANADFDPQHRLCLRPVSTPGRFEIPPQRAHALLVAGLAARVLPLLGPDSAILLVVDTARHIGARRLWILGPAAEAEVYGTFHADPLHGGGESAPLDLEGFVSLQALPLPVPVEDVPRLQELLDGLGVSDFIAVERPGLLRVRGDRLEGRLDRFEQLLTTLGKVLPPGTSVPFLYRDSGADRLFELRPGEAPAPFQLRARWPEDFDDSHLPIAPELRPLIRDLFHGPRPLRLLTLA